MSPLQHLREFISERLTAAAEEIFTEFEKTIVQYEEVIDRQRRLLDITWKPQINFHTADLPQQLDCKEEEVLADQQLFKLEMNSSLDQEEPEPPQVEEDQEEPEPPQVEENQEQRSTNHQAEQLVLKDETDMVGQCKSESEEMFTEIENNNIQSEEETDHLPRELNSSRMPQLRKQRIDVSHLHICKEEEEDLTIQQLCNQERNCSMDQDEPEPPQIKEEQEQQSTNQEGDQLVLKQETETFIVTPNNEDSDHMEPEPNSNQLFSHNSLLAEHHVQEANRDVFSGSTINTDQKMDSTNRSHNNNMDNSSRSDGYRKNVRSKKSVESDVCGKTLKKKSPMKKHHSVDTGEKPHSCNVCGKCFTRGTGLTVHMRTHTGEKPYFCTMCEKRFSISSTLISHMRTHTGEKPYTCQICGKSFIQSSTLNLHVRTHTGEKPYSCRTCGKCFGSSSHLIVHMRTHTGEKPYSCVICEKCFAQSNRLNEHMRTHTGEKPYSCKICEKSFSKSCSLTSHMRIHTGEKL